MALCPFATQLPIKVNIGGPMQEIRGFAAHSQVGYGSLYTTFANPARKASTHFWIGQNGELEQYVDTDRQAWAHGPGNAFFWSSEFEGLSYNDGPDEMNGDPFTSAQLDTAGRLIAWLHGLEPFPVKVNADGLDGYGLTPHRTLMQTACPGKLRLSQYPELVLATLRHLDEKPPAPTPAPTPEDEDMDVTKAVYVILEGYRLFGNSDDKGKREAVKKVLKATDAAGRDHAVAETLVALAGL